MTGNEVKNDKTAIARMQREIEELRSQLVGGRGLGRHQLPACHQEARAGIAASRSAAMMPAAVSEGGAHGLMDAAQASQQDVDYQQLNAQLKAKEDQIRMTGEASCICTCTCAS